MPLSVVALCALALTVGGPVGCESAPERSQSEAGRERSAVTDAVAEEEEDAEADPLAAELEAFEARLKQAAETSQEPANRAPDASAGQRPLDIDWLTPGEGVEADAPVETAGAEALPNAEGVDIGKGLEVEGFDPTPTEDDREPSINEPTQAEVDADPDVAEMDAAKLVQALGDRIVEEGGASLRPWLARAALTLADPTRELTADDLSALSLDDQRLVLAYQRMFTHLGRSLGDDAEADRRQVELAAEELLEQLQPERNLSIRKAELCTRVNGYGIYEPFQSTTFVAGQQRPAIVYVELDDFQTERNGDGKHVVQLRQEIVLYNASDGLAVWRVDPTDIVDESRNRRRDFFLVQVVKLPASLNVGRYLLKVTITDEIGEAVDEATIPIEFVADGSAQR
ncbi:MAG: hypothetical protein WD294_05295 [Phycisphaeraceae bacterium]